MTPEQAVLSICADARFSRHGKHADYIRCILSQVVSTTSAEALAALRAKLKELEIKLRASCSEACAMHDWSRQSAHQEDADAISEILKGT